METDKDATRDGEDRGDNVVRFPKDWIGPLEDLVPIGSRRSQAQISDTETDDDVVDLPAGASDFWGEGAAAVHEVITAPVARPRAAHDAPASPTRTTRRLGLPRARLTAAAAAVGVAALAAGGIAVFVTGGTTAPSGGTKTSAHQTSTTTFASDPLPLRRSGSLAGHEARVAASSDTSRLELAGARRLMVTTERAMSVGRSAHAVAEAQVARRHAASAAATVAPSADAAAPPEAVSAPMVTTVTPSASPAATTVAAPASTPSSTSSSGGTASSPSGASSGSNSDSTTRTYGYGGLLGAGHSGS